MPEGDTIHRLAAYLAPRLEGRELEGGRLADDPTEEATGWARDLLAGPTFAHMMTKTMLEQEWSMSVDQAIEAEAQAQAICMQTRDFERAYRAFVNKERPVFEGN